MHKTQARRVTLLCVRVFVISLIAGAALLTLHLVMSGSSQPARAWECEDAGVQAQTAISGTILISPTVATVGVGEKVTVTVWLSDVADYYGVDFHLSFDPNVVYSAEVTPLDGAFDLSQSFIITKVMSGEVQYAVSNHNPAKPFTGTGRVCAITFQALAPVSTTLHFTYAKGCTRDGDALYPTREGGEITVGAAFEMTPTTIMTTTPFAIQVYPLILTNNETVSDTFVLTNTSSSFDKSGPQPAWTVEHPASVTVGAGLTRTVEVTVLVPFVTPNWVTNTVVLTVTSQNNPASWLTSTLKTWTGGYWHTTWGKYVGCRFDFNYDLGLEFFAGVIDIGDIQSVNGKFNASPPDPRYDRRRDMNYDLLPMFADVIDIGDIQAVRGRFNKPCLAP